MMVLVSLGLSYWKHMRRITKPWPNVILLLILDLFCRCLTIGENSFGTFGNYYNKQEYLTMFLFLYAVLLYTLYNLKKFLIMQSKCLKKPFCYGGLK